MDNHKIKVILEKEIKRHYNMESSYRFLNKGSRTHKLKITKHMHKRHELIELAGKLGFNSCKHYTVHCMDCMCILGISKKKTWDKEIRCLDCGKIEIKSGDFLDS